MAKKSWRQPVLDTIDIRMTLEGKGTLYVDLVTPSDLDVTNTPPPS